MNFGRKLSLNKSAKPGKDEKLDQEMIKKLTLENREDSSPESMPPKRIRCRAAMAPGEKLDFEIKEGRDDQFEEILKLMVKKALKELLDEN